FRDHVLTGAGPNGFGLLYPQYAHGNYLIHTQHAHNGFLQVADDAGLLGIAALLVLAAASAGALLGFSMHNQLDAENIWKAPAFALAVVGAIIARNYRESTAEA